MISINRLIKTGVIQAMLLPGIALPFTASRANAAPPSDAQAEAVNSLAQQERARILAEVEKTQVLLRAVLEAQARQDEAARKILEEQSRDKLEKSAEETRGEPEFGGPRAVEFRKQIAAKTDAIQKIAIDRSTSKESVDEYLKTVKEAGEFAKQQLETFQNDLREATAKLPEPVKQVIERPIDSGTLDKILKSDRLSASLRKLDPTLTDKDIEQLAAAGQLGEKILDFSKDGKWSPELLAAFGNDFQNLTGIEVPEEWNKYVNFAKDVVDAHRTADDFGDFARGSLEAALSTGNPYVIAATVAILALIALFKALFGGGGGGDGDGDGKGKGERGRNTGSGVPVADRSPQGGGRTGPAPVTDDKPRPPGKPVKAPEGKDVFVTVQGDELKVFPADAGPTATPKFTVKISELKYEDGADGPFNSAADFEELTSISLNPVNRFSVRSVGGTIHEVVEQAPGRFVLLPEGKALLVKGAGDGEYEIRSEGSVLRVRDKDGKIVQDGDGNKFEISLATGVRDHLGNQRKLDFEKIADAKVNPQAPLALSFRYDDGSGAMRYRLERREDNQWQLTKPFPDKSN